MRIGDVCGFEEDEEEESGAVDANESGPRAVVDVEPKEVPDTERRWLLDLVFVVGICSLCC